MPKEKKPVERTEEPEEIGADVKEVMEEHTRIVRGRGPSTSKEMQRKRAIVNAAMRAIEKKDERAFSAELRRAGVKDGSPEWKNAWEIYRSASARR